MAHTKGFDLITVTLDHPTPTSAETLSAEAVSGPHVIDAGHFDTRPATGRIEMQISVQLPAHYLVAALVAEQWQLEDLETVQDVREGVAIALMCATIRQVEETATEIALAPDGLMDPDTMEWINALRVKVAEAFAPCDPWALPVLERSDPKPRTVIPFACDPN